MVVFSSCGRHLKPVIAANNVCVDGFGALFCCSIAFPFSFKTEESPSNFLSDCKISCVHYFFHGSNIILHRSLYHTTSETLFGHRYNCIYDYLQQQSVDLVFCA